MTLRNATANWQAALTAIEEATLALEEAMEAERVAGEELTAGAATAYLVMETVQARRDVELEKARHTHDALIALAELKYLVGYPANAPHWVIADTMPVAAADDSEAGPAMPELEEERLTPAANLKTPLFLAFALTPPAPHGEPGAARRTASPPNRQRKRRMPSTCGPPWRPRPSFPDSSPTCWRFPDASNRGPR